MILQTARFSRITTAAGLFVGALGMLAGMALTPWEPEDTSASFIQTISANSLQGEVAPLFLHYGWVFLSISVLGLLTMVRHRAVIWGRAAGLLAFVGLVNLSGMLLVDWFALALGQSGLPIDEAVGILEGSATPVNMAAWQIQGLIGVYFGLPLFLLALWRNGFIPWCAGSGRSCIHHRVHNPAVHAGIQRHRHTALCPGTVVCGLENARA
ncbi:hypothetical protein [Arthrobacter sp. ISL-30]|uniref:hypothetical protein n=1 Tax=Arthrobacter sp. ISL-30 TaxID=2819109 RepID=UPI001BED37AD|nr:hypothetical protein [Arthrobacter sp. ISL-30]MBT2514566.1 hypothetical protein [Arthrobacter sp. ISL-30]